MQQDHRGEAFEPTAVERTLHRWANALLAGAPTDGLRARLIEFLVFGAKQAWGCVFGAAMLLVLVAARLWYPDDAALARNDALVVAAVLIQVVMITTRLETGRELVVIVMFHIVGTAMELFKTSVGSWEYPGEGVLHLGAVPLYTGFMYAAVGSYLVRVYRLFDLTFTRYPPRWTTAVVAALIYLNFFAHHYIVDIRWGLVAAVVVLYARTTMHFRVFRGVHRMPILAAFVGVAFFIWLAENIGTASGAWLYPGQVEDWHVVPLSKLVAWFLLMIISVVMVAWVYPPAEPDITARRPSESPTAENPRPSSRSGRPPRRRRSATGRLGRSR